jgi:hypothetical protein
MSTAPGPWVSDGKPNEPTGEPGSIGVFDEALYEGQDLAGSFDRGDEEVGRARGVFVVLSDKKSALTTITLEFNDGSSLVAAGSLPFGSSIKDGVLAVTGRTGTLGNALPRLKVEVKNPKKYSNQP